MLLMNWPFSFLVSCTKALKLLNCNPLGEVKPGESLPLSVKILGKENKVHLRNTSIEGPQNSFICGVKSNATGNIHKTVPCPISAGWHRSHSSQWRQMEVLPWTFYLCSVSMGVVSHLGELNLIWNGVPYIFISHPSLSLGHPAPQLKTFKSRDKVPWSLCLSTEAQAAEPSAGIGITTVPI